MYLSMASVAPSPLASSVEKTNGAKLSRLLIDGGTTVLRKIFDGHHPPANLIIDLNANYSILNNLLSRRVLNGHQWDKLFPPGGVAADSKTFDITLLFLLLTNICGLAPPPSGWHTKPLPSDTSHEDNLARVKFYRNVLYGHVTTTGVDTPTFSALWTEISGVLVSLGLDQAEVDRLKAEKGGEQDYIDVLIEWADSEEDIKSQLKNIHQSQSLTNRAVEDVRHAQAKLQKTVEDIHLTQASTQKTVEDIHQTHSKTQKTVDAIHQSLAKTQKTFEDVHQTQANTQKTVEDVRHAMNNTQQSFEEVAAGLKEIKETVDSLNDTKENDRTDEVLSNLTKSEFRGDIEYYAKRFQQGTREWVFDRVQNWLDDRSSQNRAMVISANAGMGKSVIAAVICRRMQDAGRLSGSHFCQYNNVRYCKPQLMIQSLACHLSRALPEYKRALVEQLSRNVGTDLNNMGVEELFALLFKEPLSAIGDQGRNMLMVIDGLDESEYEGRNELLDVIANQFIKLANWIRFLLTTRPAINITEKLKHLKPFELNYNDEKNIEDVRVLFQKNLEHVVKLGNLGEYVERLVLKSEGLMLYAHFLILAITENPSIFHEGDLVGSSPSGISSVYHSYFERLERELLKELHIKEENFLNLLSAIAASREPLPVGFVSKILVPNSNSPLARRKVLRALGSVSALLPVRDDCLHVIHKSVKDWLTDISCYGEHEFSTSESEGHRIQEALCTDELKNLKRKSVNKVQFSITERYALYHGAHHMLHKSIKREPHELNELTRAYILDLEIVYAKTCVNSTTATEDLEWLKKQGTFTLLSKDNQSIVDTLLFLLRKNLRLLTDTPHTFLQTIPNQGGKVLTVEASHLLQNKYPEIPYMEDVHKETQQGGVLARFECSSDVICLDVSSQLDYMVCECEDGMLHLWSLHTGKLVWTRPVVEKKEFRRYFPFSYTRNLGLDPSCSVYSFFRSVVFHPTKECILSGSLSQVYTMEGDLKPLFPGSNCRFSVCSISCDKTMMLTNCLESRKCLVWWSLENGSEVHRIYEHENILSFAWSGDGRLLAISHYSGVISLVDVLYGFRFNLPVVQKSVRTHHPLFYTARGDVEVFGMVKFSPDHRFVLCCSIEQLDQVLLCLKVVEDAPNRFSLTKVSYDSKNFEFFSDCGFFFGDLIATDSSGPGSMVFGLNKQHLLRSSGSSIEMVDTNNVRRIEQGTSPGTSGIALSLDGQTVFIATGASVTAYDVFSGNRKAEIKPVPFEYLCSVKGGVLMSKGRGPNLTELWDYSLSKTVKVWTNLNFDVEKLIPISEERVAVVGIVDVAVLDTSSGTVVSTIPSFEASSRVLTCNSKCQLLIDRTRDGPGPGYLQLLDGTTLVWQKEGFGTICDYVRGAFSPKEQFLVVASARGMLVLDSKTGNTLRTLLNSRQYFAESFFTFISDDECVACSGNYTYQLLNVKSGELLTAIYHGSFVTCLAACLFNRVVVFGLAQNVTPNFKVFRACLPRGDDSENSRR